jgi:PAS domain S-box-containing protein
METPIRVLHVEDNPADRERVRGVLSRVGGFVVVEATRVKEFERLLSEGEWDCVLTDIQLSGYTGLDVLDRVNAMQLGVPVVFLAGGGFEEVAVEAMKRGAVDYILKTPTHYEKLPLVLRNAVAVNRAREARARTQKILEQSEAAYRQLFHANPNPMWIYDVASLKFLEVNDAAVAKYGWSREEFLGMTIKDIRPPEDVPKLLRFLEGGRGRAPEGRLWRYLRKNGEMMYVESISHSLEWEGRRAQVVLVNDVTERVQIEEEMRETLAELNTLHQAAPVGIALVSSRTVLRGNQAFSDMSGYPREDLMLLPAEKLFGSETEAARFFDVSEPQLASAGQVTLDQQIRRADGSLRWVRITARTIDREAPWKGEVWVVEDLERARRAEDALGRLAEDLAEAQRVGHLGSWSRNLVTGEVVYSAEQYRLLGLEPSSAPPPTVDDFIQLLHPGDRQAMAEAYRRLTDTGEPQDVEFRVPLPEGGVRWVHAAMRAERDAAGRVVRAFGVNQDVTLARQAQEEIRRTRDFYLTLLQDFPTMIWRTREDGLCDYVNQTWLKFTGFTLEQGLGTGSLDAVHPDDRESMFSISAECFRERKPVSVEYRMRHASGEYRWVRDMGKPYYDDSGRFAGYIGTCFDITERVRAEEAVRASEARLKQVLESMPVMLDAFDGQGNIVFWNAECERVTGYGAAEIVGNPRAMELLYPDAAYRERMLAEWKARGDDYRDWEWVLTARDGAPRHVIWSNLSREHPIPGWATWGTGVDITKRRRAEQLLEESEKRFRALIDAAADGIFIADVDGRIIDFNTAACESLGYGCEELMGKSFLDIDTRAKEVGIEEVRRLHFQALEQPLVWEGVHRRRDGSTFPVQVRISGVRIGERAFVVGIARDMTEQRRAEEALRESEARFRVVAEKSADFIALLGRDGQVQFVGPAVRELLGFDPGEMVGRGYPDFVAPADADRASGVFLDLLANPGSERRVRLALRRKAGGTREFDIVARNLLEIPAVGGIVVAGQLVGEPWPGTRQRHLT